MNPAATRTPGDMTRDHWRTVIINNTAREMGYTTAKFEPVLLANQAYLGGSMLTLLDELCDQELREGRTHGMELGCRRRCTEIARAYKHLASNDAPRWLHEAPPQQELANQF